MQILDKGKPIKSVVIGTGRISEEHLKFLRNRNDIFLSAVCDISPALAKFAANRYGAVIYGRPWLFLSRREAGSGGPSQRRDKGDAPKLGQVMGASGGHKPGPALEEARETERSVRIVKWGIWLVH
jgi:hypothetical protein